MFGYVIGLVITFIVGFIAGGLLTLKRIVDKYY